LKFLQSNPTGFKDILHLGPEEIRPLKNTERYNSSKSAVLAANPKEFRSNFNSYCCCRFMGMEVKAPEVNRSTEMGTGTATDKEVLSLARLWIRQALTSVSQVCM